MILFHVFDKNYLWHAIHFFARTPKLEKNIVSFLQKSISLDLVSLLVLKYKTTPPVILGAFEAFYEGAGLGKYSRFPCHLVFPSFLIFLLPDLLAFHFCTDLLS